MASRPMISSVCITAILLLLLSLTLITGAAGRPEPVLTPGETRYEDVGGERFHVEEENCEGVGEEECLMRRTLAAHTDYIYTQKNIRP